MNIIAPRSGWGTQLGDTQIPLPGEFPAGVDGSSVQVGFRPERVTRADKADHALTPEDGTESRALREYPVHLLVDLVEELGSEAFAHGHFVTAQGEPIGEQRITTKVEWQDPPARGDILQVLISEDNLHFFSTGDEGRALWDTVVEEGAAS